MNDRKRPLGSHKHLHMVACDRCGHKEDWSLQGFALMKDHIAAHIADEAKARKEKP